MSFCSINLIATKIQLHVVTQFYIKVYSTHSTLQINHYISTSCKVKHGARHLTHIAPTSHLKNKAFFYVLFYQSITYSTEYALSRLFFTFLHHTFLVYRELLCFTANRWQALLWVCKSGIFTTRNRPFRVVKRPVLRSGKTWLASYATLACR